METVFNQMSQVLGTTLLHSLWQAFVMYVLLRLFLACFPATSSANKYNAGLVSLAGSVLWPIVTFLIEMSKHNFTQPVIDSGTDILPFVPLHHTTIITENLATSSYNIDTYLPYIVAFWLIGIALNSAKLLWGWRSIYRIKNDKSNAQVLENSVDKLAAYLKISQKIKVFVSAHVDVPCIIGYLKPMIILPAAVISQFSADQIQSILIHEMAHIRRNDYFVNVLQQIVGILFFFNPFTLLINRIIYAEREHCCDDMVLEITGQPLVYAQTLLQLEETRKQNWQLAVAATGKKYHLLTRIKRIMETKKQTNNFRHILVAVLLLTGSMGTIAWLNPEIKDGKLSVIPISIPALLNGDLDTVKNKKHITTKKTVKSTITTRVNANPNVNINYTSQYNDDDPKLNKLVAEIEKRSEAFSKVYSSKAYQEMEKEMEKHSTYIDSFYNRPEFKRLQDSIDRQSEVFSRMNDKPEMKELEKRMESLGKTIDKYYNSAEYKRLEKIMELQSKLLTEQSSSKSAEYDKQREAYEKTAKQFKDYNNSPEIKQAQDEIREASKKMQEYYSSDEYKAQRDAINRESAELRKMYQSPMLKVQNEQIKKLSEQLRAYQKSPEMLKQKEALKQAEEALKTYRNSPEFKKHQEKIQKELNKLLKDAQYNVKSDTTSSGK